MLLMLVSEVMHLPADDPLVQRGVMFTILPCIAMLIAPRQIAGILLPGAVRDPSALAAAFVDFTLAGLDALVASHRSLPVAPRRRRNRIRR